ncbi:hypothetical protein ACV07N_08265 [Roseivirga echinicomitans]
MAEKTYELKSVQVEGVNFTGNLNPIPEEFFSYNEIDTRHHFENIKEQVNWTHMAGTVFYNLSHTQIMYKEGCSGICVEPNHYITQRDSDTFCSVCNQEISR